MKILCCSIFGNSGPLELLSNYSMSELKIDKENWPSVEHYYQAKKYTDQKDVFAIKSAPSAAEAKKIAWGLSHTTPKYWSETKLLIMKNALEAKFAKNTHNRNVLIGTWPLPIIEANLEDPEWGVGFYGLGKNLFGKLLTSLRDELVGQPTPIESFILLNDPKKHNNSEFKVYDLDLWYNTNMHASDILSLNNELRAISVPEILLAKQLNDRKVGSPPSQSDLFEIFDKKYSKYKWNNDARAVVKNWVEITKEFLESVTSVGRERTLVLGAGAGDETHHLWSRFSLQKLVLSDVGTKLCKNITVQLHGKRKPEISQFIAQNLNGFETDSIENYIALRVFQSFHFDKFQAAKEAARVLRQNGRAIISIANAYQSYDGKLVRGLIDNDGMINPVLHLEEAAKTAEAMIDAGFELIQVRDLQTELAMVFQLDKQTPY